MRERGSGEREGQVLHLQAGLQAEEGPEHRLAAADPDGRPLRLEAGAQKVLEGLAGDVVPQQSVVEEELRAFSSQLQGTGDQLTQSK